MKVYKSKGFTIIELLVVVAIIAVLVAVVLVNVTHYINKGKNAAVKANLSTVLTNGAVYFESALLGNGTYDGFCDSSFVLNSFSEANNASGGTAICQCDTVDCVATATAWCACSPMKITDNEPQGSIFCVDYRGTKEVVLGGDCSAECSQALGGICVTLGQEEESPPPPP